MQLRIRTCHLRVQHRILACLFECRTQGVDRIVVSVQAILRIGQRQVRGNIVRVSLQSRLVFRDCLRQQDALPVSFGSRKMQRARLAHQFFGNVQLLQCRLGVAQLEVGKCQSKVGFTIVGAKLDGFAKILLGFARQANVILHIAAVHVARGHRGISLKRAGEIVDSFLELAIMGVHVSGDQGKVFVLGHERLETLHNLHRLRVALQEQQVISQVDGSLRIARQFLNHPVTKRSRCLIILRERQIALVLAHHLRIFQQRWARAIEPRFGNRELVSFQRRVDRARHNKRIGGSQLVRLLVAGLCPGKFPAFGVHVAQRQKRHEVIRVQRRELVEIRLCRFGIAHLPREISHRSQSSGIGRRKL